MVNEEDVNPPVPSDAPEIDAFAERILSAFERFDVVNVPGLIRLRLRTIEARQGATIDGRADDRSPTPDHRVRARERAKTGARIRASAPDMMRARLAARLRESRGQRGRSPLVRETR